MLILYLNHLGSSVLVMQSQILDLTRKVFRISKESLAYYLPKNHHLEENLSPSMTIFLVKVKHRLIVSLISYHRSDVSFQFTD
ncbi:MAG: hypothetical protein DWQ58_11300 [Microcystis aeruginosa TA09]|nr:MAG: hypothetical protein DWQ58_11300 [Microcystis aeruginosa TA09]